MTVRYRASLRRVNQYAARLRLTRLDPADSWVEVDDSDVGRELLRGFLDRKGFEVDDPDGLLDRTAA